MLKTNPETYYPFQVTDLLKQKAAELVELAYDDKIDQMQEFFDTHREACIMMTYMNIDVLSHALDRKQFVAYAVLNTNGFQLPFENDGKTERFEALTEAELEKLRSELRTRFETTEIYLELEQNMSSLVKKLMLKTKLANNLRYMEFFHTLKERYEELELMPKIRPILVIIAASDQLKIVCDFHNWNSGYTLPGMPFVNGLCDYNTHTILLIANWIHSAALASMVHEFIHYVMFVLYINQGLPYSSDDLERKAAYSKVYETCANESKLIVNSDLRQLEIFKYEDESKSNENLEDIKKAEIIILPACVPTEYREETVMRYEQCLTPLFDFYKKYTFPDIVDKANQIEAEWGQN